MKPQRGAQRREGLLDSRISLRQAQMAARKQSKECEGGKELHEQDSRRRSRPVADKMVTRQAKRDVKESRNKTSARQRHKELTKISNHKRPSRNVPIPGAAPPISSAHFHTTAAPPYMTWARSHGAAAGLAQHGDDALHSPPSLAHHLSGAVASGAARTSSATASLPIERGSGDSPQTPFRIGGRWCDDGQRGPFSKRAIIKLKRSAAAATRIHVE